MKNRLKYFEDKKRLRREPDRFWWFSQPGNTYLPVVYQMLSDKEFSLLIDWFEETERRQVIGECNIPAITTLIGFVAGSSIDAIVQCGHYAGYSTLLLGFILRKMGKKKSLFSIDIDPEITRFTESWVRKADLTSYVSLECGDSADPRLAQKATEYFGHPTKAVFIDSSHQYEHTLRELNLWFENLAPGGLIFLHDVSDFAAQFDRTGLGGVRRAIEEWRSNQVESILVNKLATNVPTAYQDGCGLGIIHKSSR